jgi:hypothetical protein
MEIAEGNFRETHCAVAAAVIAEVKGRNNIRLQSTYFPNGDLFNAAIIPAIPTISMRVQLSRE